MISVLTYFQLYLYLITHHLSLYSPTPNTLQLYYDTPLMLAIRYGHPEAIKALLTAPDIDVNHGTTVSLPTNSILSSTWG